MQLSNEQCINLTATSHADDPQSLVHSLTQVLLLASLLCIFTSLIGLTGLILNSRPILAFYNLLLWPTLLSMCLVGYTSYKRGHFNLDRKLNQVWSQFLGDEERLRVQNSLRCCGYLTPLRESYRLLLSFSVPDTSSPVPSIQKSGHLENIEEAWMARDGL